MNQPSLFDVPRKKTYPVSAGWQRTDTSHQAAEQVDAETWRARVLHWIKAHHASTADEIAAGLGASILTIRPRVTELQVLQEIVDSGSRRPNASGKNAIVWQLQRERCPDCKARIHISKPTFRKGTVNWVLTCTACSYRGERSTRT